MTAEVQAMLPQETVRKKRDGDALTPGEIAAFIQGLTAGDVNRMPGRCLRDGDLFQGHDL